MDLVHPRTLTVPRHSTWRTRLVCRVWGHHVDNHLFRKNLGPHRWCRCGDLYLTTDGSYTRVRHTLSCFLGHHTYVRMAARDGHHEYACVQCGHPLVFEAQADPYAAADEFKKKVRYLCGLFGHRVHRVGSRNGFVEYTCHCGHSFLKDESPRRVIRHPLTCLALGHYVRYVTSRAGYSEYVCRNCGHPFCFADPEAMIS
jgi:DNA-directed RNA polymerase subunit RPC12/RpoP